MPRCALAACGAEVTTMQARRVFNRSARLEAPDSSNNPPFVNAQPTSTILQTCLPLHVLALDASDRDSRGALPGHAVQTGQCYHLGTAPMELHATLNVLKLAACLELLHTLQGTHVPRGR